MKPCKDGKHNLIRILTTTWDSIGEVMAVVRWCKYCGAIVVDAEIDNRTAPGDIRPMRFPEILKLFPKE